MDVVTSPPTLTVEPLSQVPINNSEEVLLMNGEVWFVIVNCAGGVLSRFHVNKVAIEVFPAKSVWLRL